ncbi:hypothetical protein [Terricaulis silvestris]|nr:hypothetical protein [Terricaulis silvestris]
MNRRHLLAGAGGLLVGCSSRPKYRLRYRLEIAARVGERVHTGASVLSMVWEDIGGAANLNGGDAFVREPDGEAIVVDLGEHGKLFGLLTAQGLADSGFSVSSPELALIPLLSEAEREGLTVSGDDVRQGLSGLTGVRQLAREHWPAMVRFRDVADRSTVELADPDNLTSALGASAAIEAVTVSVVDAPVTRRIKNELPWLNSLRGSLVWPAPGQPIRVVNRITRKHFIQNEEERGNA